MDKNKKTIFIIVSQTIIIRNILRSGVFELLRKEGHKLVIFLNCKKLPEYIKEEFGKGDTVLIALDGVPMRGIHRRFIGFTHLLLFTKTTRRYFKYSRHFIEKSRLIVFFYLSGMRVFSSIGFLKPFSRWVEQTFFKEEYPFIKKYFDEHTPDLVFGTSITSKIDNVFLKEAKRRGVVTVGMPKSWDTVTKMYYRFIPDYFLVQNTLLEEQLVKLQDVPHKRIFVVGFPQFDWYAKSKIIRSKEEHFNKLGLDPKRELVFFCSQGSWYDKDYLLAEKMYEWVKDNKLAKPAQLLVRPHFSNVKVNPFIKYQNLPYTAYDNSYHISDAFRDNWDPTEPETVDFVNSLAHASVVVVVLSTVALDATCLDKPVVNALFSAKFRKGKDITPLMQYSNHYEWVLETNATYKATSFEELKTHINSALRDPQRKEKERKLLRTRLCYKVDGQSSARVVAVLLSILSKK